MHKFHANLFITIVNYCLIKAFGVYIDLNANKLSYHHEVLTATNVDLTQFPIEFDGMIEEVSLNSTINRRMMEHGIRRRNSDEWQAKN